MYLIRTDGSTIAVKAIFSDAKMFYQFFVCLFIYQNIQFRIRKESSRCSISIQTEIISLCKGLAGDSNEKTF